MSVLVIAEVNNQGLKPSVANLVGAALKVGADVLVHDGQGECKILWQVWFL